MVDITLDPFANITSSVTKGTEKPCSNHILSELAVSADYTTSPPNDLSLVRSFPLRL